MGGFWNNFIVSWTQAWLNFHNFMQLAFVKLKDSSWEKLSSYEMGLKFSGMNYSSPTLFIGEFSIVSWLDLHNRRRTAPNVSKSHIITLAFASSVSTNAGKVGLWNFQLGHCKAFRVYTHRFFLFEIDYTIFYTNLHKLFCQFISWTNCVKSGKLLNIMSIYGWYERTLRRSHNH